ncbi:hypothetical protein [Lutibacter citreus]|uniref:hypothetical protein n=1 Tax=Lutibacter citreus TaxID=2138210 RepID=UPI000DBE8B35|nr:hypothetical protein [Lutibacter citreus]
MKNFNSIKYEIDKERNENPKLKILSYWSLFSFVGIIIIKTIIRPKQLHISEFFIFLQGTLPNYFAGAGLFSLAFIFYRAFFSYENSIIKRIVFSFLFSFVGLTMWELVQYFMGYPVDYYDIIMTAIGGVSSIIIVLLIRIKNY